MFIRRFIHPSLTQLLQLAAFASAGMLGAALVAQYGFGLHPCELCLLQRYPYVAVIVIGAVGSRFVSGRGKKALALLCAALFFLDAGIAFYHAGVETGLFTGPTACSSNGAPGESLEALRAEIMHAQLVPCNQAMGHVFGLSLAAWNALAATLFGMGLLIMLARHREDEP